MRRIRAFALACALVLPSVAPAPAMATCAPGSMCSCDVSASGVNFGNYNPLDTGHLDIAGTIRVQCTQRKKDPLSFDVQLSAGGSGGYAARWMAGSGSQLQYNLYRDAARAQIWGNGTGGSTTVTRSFDTRNIDDTISVYGRAFSGQAVNAGSYVDTIVVTVVY